MLFPNSTVFVFSTLSVKSCHIIILLCCICAAETVFLVNFEDLQVCSIKVYLVVISLEVETVFVSIVDLRHPNCLLIELI